MNISSASIQSYTAEKVPNYDDLVSVQFDIGSNCEPFLSSFFLLLF